MPQTASDSLSVPTVAPLPIVAVVGAKDGVGKTSLAVNLATVLARGDGSILVDLDLHFGGVESALRVQPDSRLDDAVRKLSSRSRVQPESFLAAHPSGIEVLCAPMNPVAADLLVTSDVFSIVERMCSLNKPVVIDTCGGLGEYALGAAERATHAVLVSRTDVASVRATRKLLDTWSQLGIDAGDVKLVINLSPVRHALTVSDVEGVVGLPAAAVIPFSEALSTSTDVGVPFVESDRNSKVARTIVKFAESFLALQLNTDDSSIDVTHTEGGA